MLLPIVSQTFSIGFKSGEFCVPTIHLIPWSSRNSFTTLAQWWWALLSTNMKFAPKFSENGCTIGSRTSFLRTSILSMLPLEVRRGGYSCHRWYLPTPWCCLPHNGHVLQYRGSASLSPATLRWLRPPCSIPRALATSGTLKWRLGIAVVTNLSDFRGWMQKCLCTDFCTHFCTTSLCHLMPPIGPFLREVMVPERLCNNWDQSCVTLISVCLRLFRRVDMRCFLQV